MAVRLRTRIKFCGMTTPGEAAAAVEAGADAVGVILAASPRRVSLRQASEIRAAVPSFVSFVAVLADPTRDEVAEVRTLGAVAQFHGDEPPELCESGGAPYVKAFHVGGGELDPQELERFALRYPGATLLVDSRAGAKLGGTGERYPWPPLEGLARRRRLVVSGGLTPSNVGECVRVVRPYAVDVRSGIESGGQKDERKMRDFVLAVRQADA